MRTKFFLPLLAVWLMAAAPLSSTPIDRNYLPWWQHRLAAKANELRAHPPRLVFYGDSIFQYLESGPQDRFNFAPVWDHYYAGRDAANLGFKGDPTSSLIWRLDHGEAEGINPRLAILLIGANNFGKLHWSAPDTVQAIEQTVTLIEQRLPHTHILLLGVLPSQRSAWVDQSTGFTNRALAARYGAGQDPAVSYVDVSPVLERDGKPDLSLYLDPDLTPPDPPLHPNPEGWRRIAARIEPLVARFMGDAPRPPMPPVDRFGR